MHPVLVDIPRDVAVILGWVLVGLGALSVAYNGFRLSRTPAREAAARKQRMASILWGAAFAVGGFLVTRYLTGNVPIYSYGVMLGISFVLGWILTLRWAKKAGIDPEVSRTCLFLVIVFAIVGARLLFVFTNLERFEGRWGDIFMLRQGGLVAYGGMIGGTLAAYVYLKLKKVNFWEFADYAAPSIALGLMFTRIGCFLYGCDYGKPAPGLALAVRFPGKALEKCEGAPAFEHHCQCITGIAPAGTDCTAIAGNLQDGGLASLPVHPTQLYEAGVGLALFALLWLSLRYRRFYGQTFLLLVLFYAVARYLIEMLRDDPQRGGVWIFSTSQLIGVLLIPLGLGLLFYLAKKQRIPSEEGAS
jgi:phosphatidylglycerol:prolipoprotein diacylglycerol transferase